MAKMTAKGLEKLMRENEPKRTALGDKLYLSITKGGSASFGFRYAVGKSSRLMGLGAFCPVNNTLAMARAKALNIQAMLKQGADPLEQIKQNQKQAKANLIAQEGLEAMEQATFSALAVEYIAIKSPEWKNAKHKQQWLNTLTTYAFPVIGNMPASKIETKHILKVLTPIWTTKTETATRVRTRMELILDYAEVHKWRAGSNPARWRGHLQTSLPSPAKMKKVKHHPALPYAELPQFMAQLATMDGIGARALEMCILHANRTQEILKAKWDEFDEDNQVWTIPEENMKKDIEHRIPLTDQAMKMLALLRKHRLGDYVFPNQSNGKHLSQAGMSSVLRRMGRTDITVHGFRSTFRDYVAEKTNTPQRTAEAALAHQLKDKAEAAYQRGDLIEKRKMLMQTWANYCYPSKRKVLQMPTAKTIS